MPAFNVLSKQCPICKGKPVQRMKGALRVRGPSFRCAVCGADLKTAFTPQVLWAIPGCALTLGLAGLAVTWLQAKQGLGGTALAAVFGVLFAVAYGISANIALRGIVFRPWTPS